MAKLKIDIVSDVVCPWCLLGKARLEQALAQMPDVEAEIHWRPYQLDPTIPRGGVDRKAYMEKKFGTGPQLAQAHARLEGLGSEVGIAYKFDAIKVAPNTIDAHRLIRWAAQAGPGIQDKVVDRLFRLYFEEGADIGNHTVLLKVAKECGMDKSIVSQLLPTDAEEAGVIGEIAQAKQVGVQGVPCFIFNQKYAVSGAQTPEVLMEAMRGAMKEAAATV
jgi:predicted DsbA family dithiol-disulfide isomerase